MMRPRPRRLLRGSPLARLSSPSSSVTRMAIRVAFVVLIAMAALTLSYQRTMLLRMDDLVVERDRLTVKKSRNEKDVTRRAQEQAKQAVKAVRKAAENTKPTTASSPGAPRKETTAAKQAKPTDKAPRVEATPTDKQPTVLEKAVDGAVPIHQNDGPLVNNITTEGNTTVMDNSTALLGTNITAVPATPLVTANLTSNEAIVVAYAISLIQCGDFQSNIAGMSDAAAVLQHSIHKHSVRNSQSGSKYDYRLYAIVHKKAEGCSDLMRDFGFEVVVRDTPFNIMDIQDKNLIMSMNKAWCCGSAEFIKLYAYLLPHPLVVHLDVDFMFTGHMDEVFDAMLYEKDSPEGKTAREKIPRERDWDPWPDKIEAAMTRDWGQVIPGRKAGYQAGFVVVRPSQEVFDQIIHTILTTNYVDDFSRSNGWGGKGYGGFVGAAAMQGLMAYFYDEVRPNTWIELNQCRFNHMGMDVLYRGSPSFMPRHPKRDQCRNDLDECEDCQITPLDQIYSIHFTQCRKPWNCIGEGDKNPSNAVGRGDKNAIPENSVILEHCLELQQTWHTYRRELEEQLFALTGDETIKEGSAGEYKKNVFQGHCSEYGGGAYLPISGTDETRRRIPELYRQKYSSGTVATE